MRVLSSLRRRSLFSALPRLPQTGLGWRTASITLAKALSALAGLVMLSLVAGWASVQMGGVAAVRPAFVVVLPMLLAIVFAFVISPKVLFVAIIIFRAVLEPVFAGTQLGGAVGLGGAVNLAVILLAFVMIVREPSRTPRAVWWVWLPFLAMQFLGLAYSPDLLPSVRLALAQTSTFAVFLVAFHLVDDVGSFNKALRIVVASSVPTFAMTLLAISRGDIASSLEGLETVTGRYAAPFSHPNVLAFYAVLVIGILLYLWKREGSRANAATRCLNVLYLFAAFGILYATKTRSAWLAAAALFLVYGLFFERRYLVYLLVAPALAMFIPEFRDRILDLTQGTVVTQYANLNSFSWRQELWKSGLAWMAPGHYLAGYGYSAFFVNSIKFFALSGGVNWAPHSVIVQMIFDFGVLGLLSYLWMFLAAFKLIRPAYHAQPLLVVMFCTCIGTYLVVSMSDNMLAYLAFNWYFWFVIGAVCSVAMAQAPVTKTSKAPVPSKWRKAAWRQPQSL